MSKPFPSVSLYDPILYQSRQNPHAIAVVASAVNLSYGEFCAHIEKVTRYVHHAGIPAGSRVMIFVDNLYLHWLLTIALSRLGLVSASGTPKDLEHLAPDVVLTDTPAKISGYKLVEASVDWISKPADHLPPFEDRDHPPEAQARIILSSGTTGTPKRALLTYGLIHRRNKQQIGDYALGPHSRLLNTMGMSSVAGVVLPLNCWSAGGTVILPVLRPGRPLFRLLRTQPNIVFLSTAQLEELIKGLPDDFVAPTEMRVYAAGSALPQKLNREARLRLTQKLFLCYGSTEIGTVALAPANHSDAQPRLTGYVVPPVQVEIIDEHGKQVPNGTIGQVRIRAEGQVELYLDDPEATAQNFRDGWFYPGDLGVLGKNADLSLVGRVRELMNIGGVKLAPEIVEQAISGTAGITDMAVFSIETPAGVRPGVAVVATGDFAEAELTQRYRAAFPALPAITIFRLDSIPRNDMGKIMRSQLAAMVAGPARSTEPAAKLH
ncbi:MAG: long-chain fatty acid--CoA ligase [Ramlibacter sp.]|nr:long-chain fatty acid--CoA ligase [Ramlibacter sp.]